MGDRDGELHGEVGDRDGELCGEVEDRVGKLGFCEKRRGKSGNFVEGQREGRERCEILCGRSGEREVPSFDR